MLLCWGMCRGRDVSAGHWSKISFFPLILTVFMLADEVGLAPIIVCLISPESQTTQVQTGGSKPAFPVVAALFVPSTCCSCPPSVGRSSDICWERSCLLGDLETMKCSLSPTALLWANISSTEKFRCSLPAVLETPEPGILRISQ